MVHASFWRFAVRRSIFRVAEGLALPAEGGLAKVDARGGLTTGCRMSRRCEDRALTGPQPRGDQAEQVLIGIGAGEQQPDAPGIADAHSADLARAQIAHQYPIAAKHIQRQKQ